MPLHDAYCARVTDAEPDKLVAWWLLACWAYEDGDPILSDGAFDALVMMLELQWDTIEHRHKALLDPSALKGRLGLKGEWPLVIERSARRLQKGAP